MKLASLTGDDYAGACARAGRVSDSGEAVLINCLLHHCACERVDAGALAQNEHGMLSCRDETGNLKATT